MHTTSKSRVIKIY